MPSCCLIAICFLAFRSCALRPVSCFLFYWSGPKLPRCRAIQRPKNHVTRISTHNFRWSFESLVRVWSRVGRSGQRRLTIFRWPKALCAVKSQVGWYVLQSKPSACGTEVPTLAFFMNIKTPEISLLFLSFCEQKANWNRPLFPRSFSLYFYCYPLIAHRMLFEVTTSCNYSTIRVVSLFSLKNL